MLKVLWREIFLFGLCYSERRDKVLRMLFLYSALPNFRTIDDLLKKILEKIFNPSKYLFILISINFISDLLYTDLRKFEVMFVKYIMEISE